MGQTVSREGLRERARDAADRRARWARVKGRTSDFEFEATTIAAFLLEGKSERARRPLHDNPSSQP